jgi:hypothetical protein
MRWRVTNETGVRMALGATAADVSRLVLGDALGMLRAGLIAGALTVLWSQPLAARVVHDLKFERAGPLAFGGGAIIVVGAIWPRMYPRLGPLVWTRWLRYGTSKGRRASVARGLIPLCYGRAVEV